MYNLIAMIALAVIIVSSFVLYIIDFASKIRFRKFIRACFTDETEEDALTIIENFLNV